MVNVFLRQKRCATMKALFLKDEQAGLLTIKDKILYVLVALFLVTFYLPHIPSVNNVVIGLMALFSFFYNSFREKYALLRQRKEIPLMVLFYIWHIVSALVSENVAEGFSWVVLRMPLLVFPVIIGLLYIKQALKERLLLLYAMITTLTMVVCTIWSVIQTFITRDVTMLYNDNLTWLTDKQSVYIALMVNLAVFCLGYLLHIRSAVITNKAIIYIALGVLIIDNFLLASRISIAMLYTTVFGYAIIHVVQKKKWLTFAGFLAGVGLLLLVLVNYFPKTVSRFQELVYTDYNFENQAAERHFDMDLTRDQWNGANIRLAVWDCALEVAKEHPVLGVQLGDKVPVMMQTYAEKKFDLAYNTRRNIHNNYLDILVAFGAAGLLLFLVGFLGIPIFKSLQTKDYLGVMIIVAFMMSFIPETYFDRSMGNMIFSFFVSLIVAYRKPAV
jgi:O-antigen ligase